MYCPKCGAQNPDGAAFCSNCGEKLNAGNPGFQGDPNAGQNNYSTSPQGNFNNQYNYQGGPQGGYGQNNFQNGPQGGFNGPNNFQSGPQGFGPNNYPGGNYDDGNVGPIGILFFCIPLAGAIAFFMWRTEKPEKAKKACYLALAGFGVGILLNIIIAVLGNT